MKRTRMKPREIAREMVTVQGDARIGWSVMVADAPRKDDVTRLSFLDYLERLQRSREVTLVCYREVVRAAEG